MIKLYDGGAYVINGSRIVPEPEMTAEQAPAGTDIEKEEARKGTIAHDILMSHNTSDSTERLKIKFDAMASHDIPLSASFRRPARPAWSVSLCPMSSQTVITPSVP